MPKQQKSSRMKSRKDSENDLIENLKMEIAAELGLIDFVRKKGWHSLSAKDAGRIGGLMAQRRKLLREQGKDT